MVVLGERAGICLSDLWYKTKGIQALDVHNSSDAHLQFDKENFNSHGARPVHSNHLDD